MIARRMAPIGWVAGVAGAALSFYLVSLQVAAERTALESVERKIAVTQRQIRHLETEFSARASLRQLEAYNQEVLALAAPKVDQYLTGEVQLASYVPGEGLPKPAEATTALASAQVAPSAPARPAFKPAVVTDAKSDNAPVIPAARRQAPLIQTVAMITPVDAPKLAPVTLKPKAKAPEKVALLDEASLNELARKAAKEGKAKTQ
jgi:hypothetical protein